MECPGRCGTELWCHKGKTLYEGSMGGDGPDIKHTFYRCGDVLATHDRPRRTW